MANPSIGTVQCPFCHGQAAVKRYAKGTRALYFYCETDGIIRPNLAHGQRWIEKHATFHDAPAANEPDHDDTPAKASADDEPRRGIFEGIL